MQMVMFLILFVVLLLAWFLGWGAFHVVGGLMHLLIILAVISLIVHLVCAGPKGLELKRSLEP